MRARLSRWELGKVPEKVKYTAKEPMDSGLGGGVRRRERMAGIPSASGPFWRHW